jgi:hypothetical protein
MKQLLSGGGREMNPTVIQYELAKAEMLSRALRALSEAGFEVCYKEIPTIKHRCFMGLVMGVRMEITRCIPISDVIRPGDLQEEEHRACFARPQKKGNKPEDLP